MKLYKFSKFSKFLSIAIIGSILLTVGCSKDLELEQCKVNYSKDNYSEAFKFCSVAAEQGYADAQYNLAKIYYLGKGVKQDFVNAKKWFEKAAKQGHAEAQCCLAGLYIQGLGVKQDLMNAKKWFEKAAKQGHAEATEFLAYINSILKG